VQIVFQDPVSALNPRRTVAATVAEPFAVHGIDPAGGREAAVAALLERVGLDAALAHRHPHALSGGERQRVGIARALALGPRVLVADEPVTALDAVARAQVLGVLADLGRELGLALLFIAHDLAVVRQVSDRVAVLRGGLVVETGPTEALFEGPSHPYTAALLGAAQLAPPQSR
jgi:ABC-type glutathione transport system ATPase component